MRRIILTVGITLCLLLVMVTAFLFNFFLHKTKTVTNLAEVFFTDKLIKRTFAKIQPSDKYMLSIEKFVCNLHREKTWKKKTVAAPGEILEFKIKIKNTGHYVYKDVEVKDVLPSSVEYLTGSGKIFENMKFKKNADIKEKIKIDVPAEGLVEIVYRVKFVGENTVSTISTRGIGVGVEINK